MLLLSYQQKKKSQIRNCKNLVHTSNLRQKSKNKVPYIQNLSEVLEGEVAISLLILAFPVKGQLVDVRVHDLNQGLSG